MPLSGYLQKKFTKTTAKIIRRCKSCGDILLCYRAFLQSVAEILPLHFVKTALFAILLKQKIHYFNLHTIALYVKILPFYLLNACVL